MKISAPRRLVTRATECFRDSFKRQLKDTSPLSVFLRRPRRSSTTSMGSLIEYAASSETCASSSNRIG